VDRSSPSPSNRQPTTDGFTHHRGKTFDSAFVIYAGPWAEARCQWDQPTLDGEDDEGLTFDDYLTGAWMRNGPGDFADYQRGRAADAELFGPHADLVDRREETWSFELERQWPVIRAVADRLISAGRVTGEELADLIGGGGAPPDF